MRTSTKFLIKETEKKTYKYQVSEERVVEEWMRIKTSKSLVQSTIDEIFDSDYVSEGFHYEIEYDLPKNIAMFIDHGEDKKIFNDFKNSFEI